MPGYKLKPNIRPVMNPLSNTHDLVVARDILMSLQHAGFGGIYTEKEFCDIRNHLSKDFFERDALRNLSAAWP